VDQPAASPPPPAATPNPTPPPTAASQADPGITIPFKWIVVGSIALIAGGVFYVVTRPKPSAPGSTVVPPEVLRNIGRQPTLPSGLPNPSEYRVIMRRMQEQLRALGYGNETDQAIASFLHDHPNAGAMQREVVAAIDRAFGERFPSS